MAGKRIYYIDGKFKRTPQASIEDRGFFFADSVYEVIRAINLVPLFLEDHLDRLFYGLNALKINPPYSRDEFTTIITKSLKKLKAPDALVYIQITRGKEPRSHLPRKNTKPTTVIITSNFRPLSPKVVKNGVSLILCEDIRWGRCDIKTTMLLPNVLAKMEAKERGYFDALFHKQDVITESTSSSFFAVKGGKIYTHPLDTHILPSITRKVVLEIAMKLNIEVVEEPITLKDLENLEGAFLAGTTYDILPVTKIENYSIPQNEVVLKIRNEYLQTLHNSAHKGKSKGF